MFLKVERYDDRQSYWLYDNIEKVSVSLRLHKGRLKGGGKDDAGCYNAIMLDLPDCGCPTDGGCNKCTEYRVIICRMKDGSEYSIAFDTVAYLLNDEGKTIEKIVANYKDVEITG